MTAFGRRTAPAPAPVTSSPASARLPVLQATAAERTAWTGEHSPCPRPAAFVTARAPLGFLPVALAGIATGAVFVSAFAAFTC